MRRLQMFSCYCETCSKAMKPGGVARHRAMHRDKKEKCVIEFSGGEVVKYDFTAPAPQDERRTR